MSRLRINAPDLPEGFVVLRPGTNRFGRDSTNDFQIDHPSVSSKHCEIIFENGSFRVRDLGSTNGTFINGSRVHDAVLKPGDKLQLGSVEMSFETSGKTNAGPEHCFQHPRLFATAECPKCKKLLCDYCVVTRKVDGAPKKFCHRCESECSLANMEFFATETHEQRTWKMLANALRYPIQKHGWVLLLGGSLLFFFIDIMIAGLSNGTPASAAMALVFGVLAAGYLFAFLQQIITSTTLGEEKMPGWPDFTEVWQDMIQPFRLLWGLFAACFGPALICWYFAYNGSDFAAQAQTPLIVLGFLYLPMALLAVAMSDNLASLNPIFVIGSICKVPLQYCAACLLLAVIVGLKWAVETAMEKLIPMFAIRYLISAPLLLYFLIVEMRVLGLMYFWNRRRLGWM